MPGEETEITLRRIPNAWNSGVVKSGAASGDKTSHEGKAWCRGWASIRVRKPLTADVKPSLTALPQSPCPGHLSGLTLVPALDPQMPRDQGQQEQVPVSRHGLSKRRLGAGVGG